MDQQKVDTFLPAEELDESGTSAEGNYIEDLERFQQEQSPPPTPQWEIPYTPPVDDDVPAWVDGAQDLESYTRNIIAEAGNRFRQTLDEEKLRSRVESAETRAMKAHDGTDGLPKYSDLVDGFAVSAMRQRPDLRQLVLAQDDPAEAAYLIGFCAAYPHLIPQVVAKNGRLDRSIFRSTNFRATVGQGSERRQPSGRSDWGAMENSEFEEALERFKASGE